MPITFKGLLIYDWFVIDEVYAPSSIIFFWGGSSQYVWHIPYPTVHTIPHIGAHSWHCSAVGCVS
jgi:hypothetical protein